MPWLSFTESCVDCLGSHCSDPGVLSQLRRIPEMRNENENGEGKNIMIKIMTVTIMVMVVMLMVKMLGVMMVNPSLRRSFIPTQKCGNLFSYLLYGS